MNVETIVARVAPHARSLYVRAFDEADHVLPRYGITSRLRTAHFLAQILHETDGLTILCESLNYSRPERLMQVWPSRFPTLESAAPYIHNPEKLAEKVYGGRMGNTHAGDGWRYIGRGMLQITGREAYQRVGKLLGIQLAENPDLAFFPEHSLSIAAAEWLTSGCNVWADKDDVSRVTHAVNGGYTGLVSRTAWLARVKAAMA